MRKLLVLMLLSGIPTFAQHSVTLSCDTLPSGSTGAKIYKDGLLLRALPPTPPCGTVDTAVNSGETHVYYATSVGSSGVESMPSNSVTAIIPGQVDPTPLTLTTKTLLAGTVGLTYGPITLTSSGGVPPYTYMASGLPPGLTISSSTIAGIPGMAGTYSVNVTVTDSAASTASGTFSVQINGAMPPPSTTSVFPATATPSVITGNDANSVELGMKFSSTVPGKITAVRYYKATNSTSAHTWHVWSAAGSNLANGTFATDSTSGWKQATLATPLTIAAGLVYTVSYHTSQYAYSQPYAWPTVGSGGILTAPTNAGVYVYGANSAFPTSTYQSSNYWVDIVFVPGSTPPPVPVTVTLAPPAANLQLGQTQQFIATVNNTPNTTVTWSANAPNGLFTASAAGPTNVIATSNADPTKSASAPVTVSAPPNFNVTTSGATITIVPTNVPSGTPYTCTVTMIGITKPCSGNLP